MTMFSSFTDTVSGKIGDLNALPTTDKSSVVGAINEVDGKVEDVSNTLANYASLDIYISNSENFPDANTVTKELVYINGYQSGLTNYPPEVSDNVGILITRWFYYSGDLTVARMQLVFTLNGLSFCRFFDGTSWTSWLSNGVGNINDLTTTDKSSVVSAINEVKSAVNTLNRGGIFYYPVVSVNNVAAMTLPKANSYTIMSISLFGGQTIPEATEGVTDGYRIGWISAEEGYLILQLVGTYATVNVGNILSVYVEIR